MQRKHWKNFEGWMNVEVRRQEKINIADERDFRKGELPGKFTAKMLYGWDNRKFEEEYLRKLERNWAKMEVSFSGGETLKGG